MERSQGCHKAWRYLLAGLLHKTYSARNITKCIL
jgi:hypothetical protein